MQTGKLFREPQKYLFWECKSLSFDNAFKLKEYVTKQKIYTSTMKQSHESCGVRRYKYTMEFRF